MLERATIQGLIAQVYLLLPKSWASMQENPTGINAVFHMQGLQSRYSQRVHSLWTSQKKITSGVIFLVIL